MAADLTQRVADHGREVVWLAAIGGNGHRALGQAARVMDIYGQASECAAESPLALFAAGLSMGRGAQQMQQMWLEWLRASARE